ncbi:GntR family transcriptional regulator [Conexibacter stalactiti]|uniref:GntR family transcriptional regulator n=1 Tax=Conexibacter stalactiti TaxID=1940611 RepID=A0ABU4HHN0_9ACTN|nr:GntR family transcriptional regulator [Conexibacter stalactiti]MDW5592813.1 GntR family transcriptional regulator [Conexibacter stalactiti]MEC5033454.1 GntR family transcriptional regulator [Conexibacter stalactiti]
MTRSARPSQADRVYSELRAKLLRGDLPIGQRLIEQQLAADFATSRTPVREALRRLEGDGHVVRDPAGGLCPAVPSVRSMRELYDVRLALEELMVRRASVSGDRGELEAILQDWRALEAERSGGRSHHGPEFVHQDESFHERIARAAGNDVAVRMLRDLNDRIRILRVHDFTSDDRVGATIADHLEIVRTVLEGDADAAAAFMRAHVQRSALVVRERVGEALARMFEVSES